MATYLITGASRGIGLELTKQLLELPVSQVSKVFAVARNAESDAIKQLEQKYSDRLYPVSASVDNTASVQKAVEVVKGKLNGQSLDVLVNNAGISGLTNGSIKDMELDQLTNILDVNVVGVQRVTAAFLPLLEQGSQKKVINMYVNHQRQSYLIYADKNDKILRTRLFRICPSCWINACRRIHHFQDRTQYAHREVGTSVCSCWIYYCCHFTWCKHIFKTRMRVNQTDLVPQWLKTDMGSEDADLSVEVGVAAVKKLILESGKEHNGRFLNIEVPKTDKMVYDYDGKDIPW